VREGWIVKPVEEIAHACLGKMLDKNKNRGTPKPYLRNLNVRWFDFDLSDVLEMKFEENEHERYTAKKR
jgi:type I restriction enzyme S subunit